MAYLISLLLLAGCARALAPAPYGQLIPLRRNTYPVYASESSGEEYEPYAVAAMPLPLHAPLHSPLHSPLHAPLPVLQLYSPAGYRSKPRRPVRRPRPEPELYAFDPARAEPEYEPAAYEHVYAAEPEPQPPPKYTRTRDAYDGRDEREERDEPSSVLVYARPNKLGGYSLRKPLPAGPGTRARDVRDARDPQAAAASFATATRLRDFRDARDPQEPVIVRIHKYRVIH